MAADREAGACIGVDVGGTFTDVVLTDGRRVWRAKSPTTPQDIGEGVIAGCRLVAERAGRTLEDMLRGIGRFGLGTTSVTNVLASRRGLRVGLITTAGFEDLVPLARGRRVNDDGWLVMPPEVISRSCIVGVDERVDRDGRVVRVLDPNEVAAAARHLVVDEEVEAIAVSFLWSLRNPDHERQAVAVLADKFPDLPVAAGADLLPVVREYERTTFALLNAYTANAFRGIDKLGAELRRLGLKAPLLLIHSAGGSISVKEAKRAPVGLAESGPAAGVAASVVVAAESDVPDAVTCDMGGTSFDVSIIAGGAPTRRTRGELMGIWTAMSLVDVESIGHGGGSIAWVDARGMLRVGPHSAGAVPGPACYQRGGTEPTVTDALVVLGYLDPANFLGGDMALDVDLAREACGRLGAQIGLDADETAWGIREIALAGMVKAVRSRLAGRGLDPRRFSLLTYGGCGALFTGGIAASIGSPRVLVPELASVLSAFGAATADVRRERLSPVLAQMPIDPSDLARVAKVLQRDVAKDLAADGIAKDDRDIRFEADLRFKRQMWELSIPLAPGAITAATVGRLLSDFRSDYALRYGEGSMKLGAPVEMVSVRAVGIGRTVGASLAPGVGKPVAAGTPSQPSGTRRVRLNRDAASAVDVPVYAMDELRPGHVVVGPALVDGRDTTVWVPPAVSTSLDRRGTLVMEVR